MTDNQTSDRVVDALIGDGLLAPETRLRGRQVVAQALATPATPATGRRGMPQLVEVVAYLGGALVLAAGVLFLVQEWGNLGFGSRVTLLAVVAVALGIAGVVASRAPDVAEQGRHDVRRRLAGSLLTGSALATALLVGHVIDETMDSSSSGVYWPAVAGAAVGVLVALVGYRVVPTAVGVLGILAGVLVVAGNLVSDLDLPGSEGDAAGVTFFLVGLAWLGVTEAGGFREQTIARTLGVAVTLFGAQVPAMDGTHAWLGYSLSAVVAVVGIAVYLRTVAWPYLAVAVVAVTLVVPEAVSDWTEGSLGATGGVLVAGLTLLLASFAGYRLRAEATD